MKKKILFFLTIILVSGCSGHFFEPTQTITSVPSLPPTIVLTNTPTPTLTSAPTREPLPDFIFSTPLPTSIMDDFFRQSTDKSRANIEGIISQKYYFEVTSDFECVHSGQYGLRIHTSKSHSWGSYFVMGFRDEPFNISEFTALNFWIKGQSGKEKVSIGFQWTYGADISSNSNVNIEISPSEWRLASIPLRVFPDSASFTKNVVNIYFRLAPNDEKQQSVCIDDIVFVK